MAKIRITVDVDMDLHDNDYTQTYDKDDNEITLTQEEADALTSAERLEHDYRALKAGAYDLAEYISYGMYKDEDVKFRLLEG